MENKFINKSDLSNLAKELHDQGKTIVFTYGTFDLIHSGHAAYLLKAKSYGDVLIVGIATNRSKKILRGNGFPLIDQKNRAELINYFNFVDYTTTIDKQNMLPTLKKMKPDVFYTLAVDWRSHLRKKEETAYLKKIGAKIVKTPMTKPFVSASQIVDRVADLKIKEIIEYFFGKVKIDLSKGNWRKTRFSQLKTEVRDDTLYFGNHSGDLDLFSSLYFGEIVNETKLAELGEKLRAKGKKVVLSSGGCDLIHAGHARFFSKAKEQGDVLVLAIPSNRVVQRQKGRGRPIVDEYSRAELMAFFGFVDYIVIFDKEKIEPLIKDLKPDVFFTVQEDWNEDINGGYEYMEKWNGKVITAPPQSGNLSSSRLIKRAAGLRVREVFKEVLDEASRRNIIKD